MVCIAIFLIFTTTQKQFGGAGSRLVRRLDSGTRCQTHCRRGTPYGFG